MTTRLVKRLDELPQSVPPGRDLWPGIAAAIEADQAASRLASTPPLHAARRSYWRPAGAMAAAIALVAVGMWIGRSMTPSVNGEVASRTTRPLEQIPAAFERDEKYRQERDALMSAAQKRLQAMPAAERDKVAASLNTLRRSITEIEAALGRDPANALLQELLVSSCQEEMRALTAVREAGGQET